MKASKAVGPAKDLCAPQVCWHVDLVEVGIVLGLRRMYQLQIPRRVSPLLPWHYGCQDGVKRSDRRKMWVESLVWEW